MTPLVTSPVAVDGGPAPRLAEALMAELVEGAGFADAVREAFSDGRPVVGVCAAGILIRILAPHLSDKREEPPVLAVSADGASVVPLLGGHRGANALAREIAAITGGHAALTTASETFLGLALDEPPEGWALADEGPVKHVTAALLKRPEARIEGDLPWIEAAGIVHADDAAVTLVATDAPRPADPATLVYHPKRLALGLGCARGAEPAEAIALAEETLTEANLAPGALACIVSLDLKADEPAVLEAARHFGIEARFFDAATLEKETPRLAYPSETVFREVGCHGVAEGAALAAAGPEGALVADKRKSVNATCAVARAPAPINLSLVGRRRGRLALVGTGPGDRGWLTPAARRLISEADSLVGYRLYLDLISPLVPRAERRDYDLGEERERCLEALRLAGEGRSVALVSSGDPGIYAMASLVFECLEMDDLPDGARRAEILVEPGISAIQAAAARAGAPLGHDFCAISLSDLMTPWAAIVRRIEAAAEADFVVGFYNPVSKRRTHQLAHARDILLRHRPADTPTIVARQLGRPGEEIRVMSLAELDPTDIDMLCLVLVGASTTRRLDLAGRPVIYTPRGYAGKAPLSKEAS